MSGHDGPLPALKERAGVVAALADGRQTLLLRDPGLKPQEYAGWFALYPAFSHQSPDRYSPEALDYYRENAEKPADGIPVRAVARVADEWTAPASVVEALAEHYVYSPAGIREKYGVEDERDEVRALLLRVAELPAERVLAERPAYRGCRTWISLDESVDLDPTEAVPVLDDESFAARREGVETALGRGRR
ncbi:DUF1802 family protein [Halospeciosus flavus]|uniref:DUF1802 family protein n=2 Tax=Halospeciosus flavus TaxID=3032283 RepID=A0ABD5Z0E2_9EURY|nr:DUF1802 family protein [Halospeciosus flavus]